MTKQIRDTIKFDGGYHTFYGGPVWSRIDKMDIEFEFEDTSNWKGHHTVYEIIDSKLHVVGFESKSHSYDSIFSETLPHFLGDFSGYVYMDVNETEYGDYVDFEKYLLAYKIVNGKVDDKYIASNLIQDKTIRFGKYKGLKISDLLFGRFGKSEKEIFNWFENTLKYLFGKIELKYSVIPSCTYNEFELLCLEVMRENDINFIHNKDIFIISDKIDVGSSIGTVNSNAICDLLIKIFGGKFTYRVKDENASKVEQSSDKLYAMIHGDRSYLRWAIKTVDSFYVPPRLFYEIDKQVKLGSIDINKLNSSSFSYSFKKQDFLISKYFSDDIFKQNLEKLMRIEKVEYLPDADDYRVDIDAHKLKLKFKAYLAGTKEVPTSNIDEKNVSGQNYGSTFRDFNGTYAQDHLGYSDDVINDAFEGDPSLVWNID